jgi:hypothetical protein
MSPGVRSGRNVRYQTRFRLGPESGHHGAMTVDLAAASAFMTTHARTLDRRRFELRFGPGDREGVLTTLDAYRNPDGGYGWAIEPDLRSPESQPGPSLHAFEVFEDVAPLTSPRAAALCDWLASVSLADGGLPFALPVTDRAGCAPWWADADPTVSSLQITAINAAHAARVARHDPAVAAHPWLAGATDYCLAEIDALEPSCHALVHAFSVQFLDSVAVRPEAAALLDRLTSWIPADGSVLVAGGTDDERMRPLDFAPFPDGTARARLSREVVAADLDRLASLQQDDGGWPVEWATFSPASTLEWRGHLTVKALTTLQRNGWLAR